MSQPKQNKERKAWLASLKTGDSVAIINDHGSCYLTTLTRNRLNFVAGDGHFTLATGKKIPKKGYDSKPSWLIPASKEMLQQKRINDMRNAIVAVCGRSGFKECTDAQIQALANILGIA